MAQIFRAFVFLSYAAVCWADGLGLPENSFKLKSLFDSAQQPVAPQTLTLGALSGDYYPGVFGDLVSSNGKVVYHSADWKIGRTPNFNIFYSEDEKEAAGYAAQWVERDYERLSGLLNQEYKKPLPVILYPSPSRFRTTNIIDGSLPEGVGGFTDDHRRVVLPFTGSLLNDRFVMAHELTHQFQFDNEGFRSRRLPLWVVEGLAEYVAQDGINTNTAMILGEAARKGFLPTIEELGRVQDIRVYIMGHSIWQFIAQNYGEDKIAKIWKALTEYKSFSWSNPDSYLDKRLSLNGAFKKVLGKDMHRLSREWKLAIERATFGHINKDAAFEISRALTWAPDDDSHFNTAPALSPDGKTIAFLSAGRDLTFGLYAGDVEDLRKANRKSSAKKVKKLATAQRSETLESLSLMKGSISWSPDGQEIAFSGLSVGDATIYIMNAKTRKINQLIRVKEVDEAFYPSWSNDGTQIVFTGLKGGLSDLYIVNRDGTNLRRLTNDPFSNLHPAWSPDGRTIAFVTDQDPGLPVENMLLTQPKIALYDLETGRIAFLKNYAGTNICPQWSADGMKIAFISDRTGVHNIFVQEVNGDGPQQMTDLISGVTGLSRNGESPAFAWARDSGAMAFSVYDERMNLNIYLIKKPGNRKAIAFEDQKRGPSKLSLVRKGRRSREEAMEPINKPMNNDTLVLRKRNFDSVKPYKPKIRPERIMAGMATNFRQLTLFAMINSGDLMGDHKLSFLYLVGASSLKDFLRGGLILSYVNQKRRTNWGLALSQLDRPFINSFENNILYPYLGLRRALYRSAEGFVSYPLSVFHRITASLQVVQKIPQEETGLTTAPYVYPHVSYVRDNTLWSYFGPFNGTRLRLEAGQAVGSEIFTRFLADGRKYLSLGKFASLATRGAFATIFGRDPHAMFIGGPGTIRGFPYGYLAGNTIAMANAELRFPFFPLILYPFFGVPLSGHLFVDAGYTHASPALKTQLEDIGFSVDKIKASAGFGIRLPFRWIALGFDWAWPFTDRDALVTTFSLSTIF